LIPHQQALVHSQVVLKAQQPLHTLRHQLLVQLLQVLHIFWDLQLTLILQELSADGGNFTSPTNLFTQSSGNVDTWFNEDLDLSAFDDTGNRTLRFVQSGHTGFAADSAIDQIEVFNTPPGVTVDGNTTAVTTQDVDGDFDDITSIEIEVDISVYTTLGSVAAGNSNPDLLLEVW
jgi:hypothetical protein